MPSFRGQTGRTAALSRGRQRASMEGILPRVEMIPRDVTFNRGGNQVADGAATREASPYDGGRDIQLTDGLEDDSIPRAMFQYPTAWTIAKLPTCGNGEGGAQRRL